MDASTTGLGYLHGYSEQETRRLADQADTLAALLHAGTAYPPGDRVLEVGCGVGAQTTHLVRSSPGARLVAVDLAEDSLAQARARVATHAPGSVDRPPSSTAHIPVSPHTRPNLCAALPRCVPSAAF